MNHPDLFSGPAVAPPAAERQPLSVPVAPHPSERLRAFAEAGVKTDTRERMMQLAEGAAGIFTEFGGKVRAWEVRLTLMKAGLISKDDPTDCFGALGARCRLIACGVERVPLELPAAYRTHHDGRPVAPEVVAEMEEVLARGHANRCTVFRAMTVAERASAVDRSQRKRRVA